MKKKKSAKQIIAIIGVVLLVGMYVSSLILAIIHSPMALNMLKISLFGTLIIPIIIYFTLMFFKLSKPKDKPEEKVYASEEDDPFTEEDFRD